MRHLVTLAIVAVLGTGAAALAQTPSAQVPGAAPRNGTAESVLPRLNLTQQQKQAVGRGLSSQPSQNAAADVQMSVGKLLPRSMTPQAMPNSVTQLVPETKNYEFVKLPDRVVMVDPTDRSIAEIIPLPASPTTGLGGDRR